MFYYEIDGPNATTSTTDYVFTNQTTATGTNFVGIPDDTKWDTSDKVTWYTLERKPEPEQPVYFVEMPEWEREWFPEKPRVRPQRDSRDNRQAVWACRPRHGLSGR